jgi:hypothetical protein
MLPTGNQVFLDHIAHFVSDADAARDALMRAGFTPTPVSVQRNEGPDGTSRPSGTGNVCAMLEEGYIEILFKTADTPLAAEHDVALQRYAGVHLIAFAVADAHRASAHLRETGFRTRPVVHLRRPVATETATAEAAFTVARVEPGEMPEGRIQYLTHHTPDVVWQPRWLTHPNGTLALTDVVIAVPDVAEAAARFARFLGRNAAASRLGRSITLDRGAIHFATTEWLRDYLPRTPALPFTGIYVLRVASLSRLRAQFEAGGFEIRRTGAMLFAPFPAALGQGGWLFLKDPRDLPWPEGT